MAIAVKKLKTKKSLTIYNIVRKMLEVLGDKDIDIIHKYAQSGVPELA